MAPIQAHRNHFLTTNQTIFKGISKIRPQYFLSYYYSKLLIHFDNKNNSNHSYMKALSKLSLTVS